MTSDTGCKVFCDFTTGGGALSWTLLTSFEQPGNRKVGDLSQTDYNNWFNNINTMWIRGGGEARPLSPNALVDNLFHIRSIDWASVLVPGRGYMLRQNFFRQTAAGVRSLVLDVAYSFIYPGFTLQDQSTTLSLRAYPLAGRTSYTDTTGISWDIPSETVLFWLPFTSSCPAGPGVYTACGAFDTSGCSYATDTAGRRPGNAGIIGAAQNNNDPAASWAPHMNSAANFDIVYVHQNSAMYGTSATTAPLNGQAIFLSYWIAPLG